MTPSAFLTRIINPALEMMQSLTAVSIKASDEARVFLLAVALQESGLRYRTQVGGPAHGWWQFESGGGVAGLFQTQPAKMSAICTELVVPFGRDDVYAGMVWCDLLACAMARLLLWTEPAPLPKVGDIDEAWRQYMALWRPGAPSRDRWNTVYPQALAAVQTLSTKEAA